MLQVRFQQEQVYRQVLHPFQVHALLQSSPVIHAGNVLRSRDLKLHELVDHWKWD